MVTLSLSKAVHEPDATVYRNELKWSNGVGNAVWTKSNMSVSYAHGAGPGGRNAWLVTPNAGTTQKILYHRLNQAIAAGSEWSGQIKVKKGTENSCALVLQDSAGSTARLAFNFDTLTATPGSSGWTIATSSVTEDEDGYYLFKLSATLTASATYVQMSLFVDAWGSTSSELTLYAAEAQLETGLVCHDYIHTETVPLRSDQVIVRGRRAHNLIGCGDDISHGYWVKTRASVGAPLTLTGSATGGYANAVIYKLVEDTTASNNHIINNPSNVIMGNAAGLFSCRFLISGDGNGRDIQIVVYGQDGSNGFYYNVDPDNGSTLASGILGTGALHSISTTQVDTVSGRPVYEVTIRGWATTTSTTAVLVVYFGLISSGSSVYTGNGTYGVYVGKIQVVNEYTLQDRPTNNLTAVAATPTKDWNFALDKALPSGVTFTRATVANYYNASGVLTEAASGAARFTHNPTTLISEGLLIEPARTNSIRNNTMVGAVAGTPGTAPTNWSISEPTGLTRTISLNTISGVECIDIAYTGTTTSSAGISVFIESASAIAAVNGEIWSNSAWIQITQDTNGSITFIGFETWLYDNVPAYLSTGASGDFSSTRTLWTRRTLTQTLANASVAYVRPVFRTNTINSGTAVAFTIRIGLPQLEKGPFATMPIKTSTVAVTRNADDAQITGADFSSWWNAIEGTFLAEAVTGNTIDGATRRVVQVDDNTANERIFLGHSTTTQSRWMVTDTSTQADITVTVGLSQYNSNRMVASYKASLFRFATNGTLGITDTSGTLPTVDRLRFGADSTTLDAAMLGAPIARVCYWNTQLNEDQHRHLSADAAPVFVSNVSGATIQTGDADNELGIFANNWTANLNVTVATEGTSVDGYTAYKLDCDAINAQHYIRNDIDQTVADSSYMTLFADIKADERGFANVSMRNKGGTFPGFYIDLSNGSIHNPTTSPAPIDQEVVSRGSGWYRVRLVVDAETGANTPQLLCSVASSNSTLSFLGAGANDGILVSRVFGVSGNIAMIDAEDYYNPVTAVVAGNNLLTYSEDFSNAAWTKTDITLASANVIGPNTVYADRVTEGTAGTAILVRATAATVSAGATVSGRLWVKRSGVVQWVRMRLTNSGATNGGDVWFDIQNGVEGTNTNVGSGTSTSGTITAAASAGWYLLTITTTLASGDTTALLSIRSASADASATPVNSSVYWVSEAALQVGAAAEYVKTVATAEHVLDRSSAIVDMPERADFDPPSGTHKRLPWDEPVYVTLTDSASTQTDDFEFEGQYPTQFGQLVSLTGSVPSGLIAGDSVYGYYTTGSGTFLPTSATFVPATAGAAGTVMGYDNSEGEWVTPLTVSGMSPTAGVKQTTRIAITIGIGI